jgi:DNA (cytosine-5)-methyltransferase 1
MKIGSLCTGYGGLDMAVEAFFDAETVWCSEFDKYASQIVDARIKKPNLGDLTKIDWTQVEPIDILTAGYPCQPFSTAGQRKGTNDKRHIFPYIAQAIEVLQPRYIVLENVRGHLTLGFEEVLGTLTKLGYDTRWQIVRASDVGAPHQRARLFILAYSSSNSERLTLGYNESRAQGNQGKSQFKSSELVEITSYSTSGGSGSQSIGISQENSGTSCNHNTINGNVEHSSCQCKSHNRQVQELGFRSIARCDMSMQEVPTPLDQEGKLNAQFVEYMMGLPKGWVTDLGLSRSQQLKILGNGVVPQQAFYALCQLTK